MTLVLDISGLVRWSGPAVGIARTEHALAQAALRRPGTVLACWHGGRLRMLDPAWRDVLLDWSGALDSHVPQPPRAGWRRVVPGRQPVVAALERLRLLAPAPVAGAAGLMQRALLAVRPHRFALADGRGHRVANVPPDLALGDEVALGPGDTLFSAGNGWFWSDREALRTRRHRDGFRHVTLCYDLIPITHPALFEADVARDFGAYWRAILPVTDRCIVTAACIARDVRQFCAAEGMAVPEIVQRPLGADPPPPAIESAPPGGLVPGRYALLVGTIEPRKGHAMLLDAWRMVRAAGVTDFQLVFAGRPGWMVGPVLDALGAGVPGVLHLPAVGDAGLEALYRGASFCVYPSVYEGFGLPLLEAFARGIPVLASTGGAVPETAAGLAPCLDPTDARAWASAILGWVRHPDRVAAAAAQTRQRFSHPTWPVAAEAILDAASEAAEPGMDARAPPERRLP